MEYTNIFQGLLLQMQNGVNEFIPFPSVQAGYGPYISINAARTALVDMFKVITNIPQGFTFCVIENNKPQEYWFTKEGDWQSIEPKNTSSSSSTTEVSNVKFDTNNGYIRVSTDDGVTWTNLVALESLRGPMGYGQKGDKGDKGNDGAAADLTQLKLRLKEEPRTVDDETIVEQFLEISYFNGDPETWIRVGQIMGGSGEGSGIAPIISIVTGSDGNKYWAVNGAIIYDDQGNPVRANGIDGRDGEDGVSREAITSFTSIVFRRTNQDISNERPTGGTYATPRPSGGLWYDGVPQGTEKLWMSQRRFFSLESMNQESAYPWSLPGQATDTADIDFEYSNAPLDISSANLKNPSTSRYSLSNPNGWYDGTEHSELLTEANWMAIRKIKNGAPVSEPASTNGWQIFKIRGEDGTNGVSPVAHFKSIAFRRSDNYTIENNIAVLNSAEYPSGGSYNSPNPTNVDGQGNLLWSDGIPQNNKQKLWETTCIFHSDGTSEGWTTPKVVADNEYMDYEYAEENPLYPKPMRRSPDDANPDYPSGITGDGWDDEPDYTKDYVWRAERPVVGNKYAPGSDWLVVRIKGEKGTDGTSVTIKGTLAAMYSTWDQAQADRSNRRIGDLIYVRNDDSSTSGTNELGIYMYNGTTYSKTNPSVGDGYLYSGDLWVWDGDSLIDVGPIQGPKGEPGKTYYLHIKYSNDGGNTFTSNNGEDPGDYIGTYVNEYSSATAEDTMDISKYKWMEWKGQDGFGYEYIFKLTETEEAPAVPAITDEVWNSAAYQDDDYVPDGWTDDPQSPYKAKPYCWVCYRKKVDGKWTKYIGQSTNKSYAALFSMYSSRGRGIASITEMYAVGTSGTIAPELSAFSHTIPQFNKDYPYLWNYEVVDYDDDSDPTNTDPACIGVYVEGKGIGSIIEYYIASSSDNKNDLPLWNTPTPDAVWSKTPLKVDKYKPYLWNYEVVLFDDGTVCKITEPVIVAYYVYTDVEYLTTIFKKVEGDSNTAYLGGLIGAVEKNDQNNDVVRAMLNATDKGEDQTHGKLFIASGMNGLVDPETGDFSADGATFKVYEDGHVEMHDATIQAFLQQYYKNQQAVINPDGTYGGASQMVLFPKKCSNYIMLGWEGFAVTNNKYFLSLDATTGVNEFSTGKIIFTNSIYIADDGITYYNVNNKQTVIKADFILPDGTLRKAGVAILRNGWIEVGKVRILTANNIEKAPTLSDLQNVYMIYSFGGNVCFKLGNASVPVVNSDSAITRYTQNLEYALSRDITSDENVVRIHPQNESIYVISDGTEDPLYVVMPRFRMLAPNALGAVDCMRAMSWIFEISPSHRQIIFKIEDISGTTPDEQAGSLEDLLVVSGSGTEAFEIENSLGSLNGTIYFRITYYPFMHLDTGSWIVEQISPVSTL